MGINPLAGLNRTQWMPDETIRCPSVPSTKRADQRFAEYHLLTGTLISTFAT